MKDRATRQAAYLRSCAKRRAEAEAFLTDAKVAAKNTLEDIELTKRDWVEVWASGLCDAAKGAVVTKIDALRKDGKGDKADKLVQQFVDGNIDVALIEAFAPNAGPVTEFIKHLGSDDLFDLFMTLTGEDAGDGGKVSTFKVLGPGGEAGLREALGLSADDSLEPFLEKASALKPGEKIELGDGVIAEVEQEVRIGESREKSELDDLIETIAARHERHNRKREAEIGRENWLTERRVLAANMLNSERGKVLLQGGLLTREEIIEVYASSYNAIEASKRLQMIATLKKVKEDPLHNALMGMLKSFGIDVTEEELMEKFASGVNTDDLANELIRRTASKEDRRDGLHS